MFWTALSRPLFLSTLSLRRATPGINFIIFDCGISIHALLAESDVLRPYLLGDHHEFLSTLSLRRATVKVSLSGSTKPNFYPRSPCGERHSSVNTADQEARFLSTLSLRRATREKKVGKRQKSDFYPRSPCGERQRSYKNHHPLESISIHALLAESD